MEASPIFTIMGAPPPQVQCMRGCKNSSCEIVFYSQSALRCFRRARWFLSNTAITLHPRRDKEDICADICLLRLSGPQARQAKPYPCGRNAPFGIKNKILSARPMLVSGTIKTRHKSIWEHLQGKALVYTSTSAPTQKKRSYIPFLLL